MADTGIYTCFKENLMKGVHNLAAGNNVIKVALMGAGFTFDAVDTSYIGLVGEIVGGTYVAGGIALGGQDVDVSGTTGRLIGTNTTWAAATIAEAHACVLYDDTAAGKPLIAAWDFGGPYSSTNGNFTVSFAGNVVLTLP